MSSSEEGRGAATEGVALVRDEVLELVISKLGGEVDVEEEVDTVIVVLVTTFGAAKGKEVVVVVGKEVVVVVNVGKDVVEVVIEVGRVAVIDSSLVELREHELIVVGFKEALDSSSIAFV